MYRENGVKKEGTKKDKVKPSKNNWTGVYLIEKETTQDGHFEWVSQELKSITGKVKILHKN